MQVFKLILRVVALSVTKKAPSTLHGINPKHFFLENYKAPADSDRYSKAWIAPKAQDTSRIKTQ